jgi:hypothetical protein
MAHEFHGNNFIYLSCMGCTGKGPAYGRSLGDVGVGKPTLLRGLDFSAIDYQIFLRFYCLYLVIY